MVEEEVVEEEQPEEETPAEEPVVEEEVVEEEAPVEEPEDPEFVKYREESVKRLQKLQRKVASLKK